MNCARESEGQHIKQQCIGDMAFFQASSLEVEDQSWCCTVYRATVVFCVPKGEIVGQLSMASTTQTPRTFQEGQFLLGRLTLVSQRPAVPS